jgi:hypothetical protein
MKQRRWRRGIWCSSACVGVLRVRRGVQELECEFKWEQGEEGERRWRHPAAAALAIDGRGHHGLGLRKGGNRPN